MDKLAVNMAGEIALSKNPGGSMKKWREIFEISQTELAEYLKVSSSTISDYEGGRRKSPGITVVNRLVSSLIEIDKKRGGHILKKLEKDLTPVSDVFNVHEFSSAITGMEFMQKISGQVVANSALLKSVQIYGYTLIDSLKVIIDVPVHEYLKLFGLTPKRALIFESVESGRSPMIAVKISRFSTDMKPSIVVLHGVKGVVDPVAVKIARTEKIPLIVTKTPIHEILKNLAELE
ncbi:MAG: helix-turn-helix domain-containing protein [archaeon]